MQPRGPPGRSRNTANPLNTPANNPYGEGAPHGDPFASATQPTAPSLIIGSQFLGRGPPPGAGSTNARTTFSNTPVPSNRTYNGNRAASLNILANGNTELNNFAYNSDTFNTSTPSNRYHFQAAQSRIPERPSQLDHVLDMLHTLLNDNAEIKGRLSSLEATLAQPRPPNPVRGVAAQRGGRIVRNKQRAAAAGGHRQRHSDDDEVIDPSLLSSATEFSTDTEAPESESVEEDGVVLAVIDISEEEKRALQSNHTNLSEECLFSVAKYNGTKISRSPPLRSSTAMPPKLSPIWAAFHCSENMPNGKHHRATHWRCINAERPMTKPDTGAQKGSGDDYELYS
ncbi:hypothetical protein C8J57DRAFT_1482995 [Mycena rebaudengoi]|nr:hypothetical protein C8J57DRAFT_1482995 [Mycena rebaudengoi]